MPRSSRKENTSFANVKKMSRLVKESSSHTIRKNKKDIELVLEIAAHIEAFIIEESTDYEHHLSKITSGEFSKLKGIPLAQKRAIDLTRMEFSINLIFFELWEELGNAIRSLLIANYRGTARSLRWIVESLIFWADMQLDGDQTQGRYGFYRSQSENLARMSAEVYSWQRHHTVEVSDSIFQERLFLKEKYRKPSFNEILNDLFIFKGGGKEAKSKEQLKKSLREIYRESSGLVHISLDSLPDKYGLLQTDYGFFMNAGYIEDEFQSQLSMLWKVIDATLCSILFVEAWFYGYETVGACLKAIKSSSGNTIEELIKIVKKHPMDKKMSLFLQLAEGK